MPGLRAPGLRQLRSISSAFGKRCRTLTSVATDAPHESARRARRDDTHFGFQQVPVDSKKGMVKDVFTSVAHNYDVMNDLMSAGMHRLWKDEFVRNLGIASGWKAGLPPPKLLDVAGGTGDIAFRVADELRPYLFSKPETHGDGDGYTAEQAESEPPLITISDINSDMLEVGKQRAATRFSSETLDAMRFVQADAEALPFDDNSFHIYTIAFGLRNVTDMNKALREAYRVLKPGGRFVCLEFSRVPITALRNVYDWYSFNVIPKIGQVVAQDRDAYQYLVESIRMFPGQEELEERMRAPGFSIVSHTNFTAGVVAVHSGFKLPVSR